MRSCICDFCHLKGRLALLSTFGALRLWSILRCVVLFKQSLGSKSFPSNCSRKMPARKSSNCSLPLTFDVVLQLPRSGYFRSRSVAATTPHVPGCGQSVQESLANTTKQKDQPLIGLVFSCVLPRVCAGSCGFLWTSSFPAGTRIWRFPLSPGRFSLRPRCPLEAEVHERPE
jgi:hypothetical protein